MSKELYRRIPTFNTSIFDHSMWVGGEKYPHHDIVRVSENEYSVILAVAGYTKKDITISVEDDYLTILGAKIKQVGDDGDISSEYPYSIYTGISRKAFKKSFVLQPGVSVKKATVVDGLLTIQLVHERPKRDVKIDIE